MSIKFAEQILDSMVDETGHCGERGLSYKQYKALSEYLTESEREYCGAWNDVENMWSDLHCVLCQVTSSIIYGAGGNEAAAS